MATLSKASMKQIEDFFINYEENKKQLYYRELELLHPYKEADENIGGGRSNITSDTTFNKTAALMNDARYNHLKNIIQVVEDVYNDLDEDQRTIVEMRYFDKKECYEWADIADRLYMSVFRVLRKRNYIIDETARRLGWI